MTKIRGVEQPCQNNSECHAKTLLDIIRGRLPEMRPHIMAGGQNVPESL